MLPAHSFEEKLSTCLLDLLQSALADSKTFSQWETSLSNLFEEGKEDDVAVTWPAWCFVQAVVRLEGPGVRPFLRQKPFRQGQRLG